jgi:hypothetical protein
MYMCIGVIEFASVSSIFLLNIETNLEVRYILFFIFITNPSNGITECEYFKRILIQIALSLYIIQIYSNTNMLCDVIFFDHFFLYFVVCSLPHL